MNSYRGKYNPTDERAYPAFFEVDDVPVKVDYDEKSKTLYAVNDLGKPWPPMKAMYEGRIISESEFKALAKVRADKFEARRAEEDMRGNVELSRRAGRLMGERPITRLDYDDRYAFQIAVGRAKGFDSLSSKHQKLILDAEASMAAGIPGNDKEKPTQQPKRREPRDEVFISPEEEKTVFNTYSIREMMEYPKSRAILLKYLLPLVGEEERLERNGGTLWAMAAFNMGGGIPLKTMESLASELNQLGFPLRVKP